MAKKRKDKREEVAKPEITRLRPAPDQGLSADEAARRLSWGYGNEPQDPPTKTVGQIFRTNLLTYFNMIFLLLAVVVCLVGAFWELKFLIVVIINVVVGIVQELQAKRALDKMNFLASPKALVVRDGTEITVPSSDVVLDDIVIFAAGNQIYADAVVVSGSCQVNESLITGEADEITKNPGDALMSGSFVLSGRCSAQLTQVGADSYVSKLAREAKQSGKAPQSEMVRSLNRLVGIVGIIIIPVGIALFYRQMVGLGFDIQQSTVNTVGALTGMIPEGLYLLTTAALTVSVIRLTQKRILVHDMRCIETLARVDVLCVDKTGTITENKMTVRDIHCLCEGRFNEDDIRLIMSDYVGNMGADNETMLALQRYFTGSVSQSAVRTLPFSSSRKYGGVSYHEDESYLLGAPEFILGSDYIRYQDIIEAYSAQGCRVLLLALYGGDIEASGVSGDVMPLALILLTNKIRDEAPETFGYFAEQGVSIRVISGDNPVTVSQVAIEAGIADAENFVDAITLDTPEKIMEAAEKYTVFGRVTPQQKRMLIRAMKAQGHTVAMTGDGVNDVLALKDADCSIAMASGSDVASQVSQLVLMDSDFAAMPSVVAEGRRVINNIERSASLFLVKNIFSLFLALISISATLPYPITPSQMSLVSGLCIGFPAFVLALEPNNNRIKGHFMRNVLYRALPAGLANVTLVLGVIAFYSIFGITAGELSTISAIIIGVVGCIVVYQVCKPYNTLRKVLFACVAGGFILSIMVPFLRSFFSLSELTTGGILILVVCSLVAFPIMSSYQRALSWINEKTRPAREKISADFKRRMRARRKRRV